MFLSFYFILALETYLWLFTKWFEKHGAPPPNPHTHTHTHPILGLSILNMTSWIVGKDRYQPNYHGHDIRGLDLNAFNFIVEKVSWGAGSGAISGKCNDRWVRVVSMYGAAQLENLSYGNERNAHPCSPQISSWVLFMFVNITDHHGWANWWSWIHLELPVSLQEF